MKKAHLLALACVSLSFFGCNTTMFQSSVNFNRGTMLLERGKYEAAIECLKEAVRLNPLSSENHNNLACAYARSNDDNGKAWFHIRQAVICDLENKHARITFMNFYFHLDQRYRFSEGGLDEKQVIEILGEPDHIFAGLSFSIYIYGRIGLKFKNGILVPAKFSLIKKLPREVSPKAEPIKPEVENTSILCCRKIKEGDVI